MVSLSITSAGQRESWGSDEYFDPTGSREGLLRHQAKRLNRPLRCPRSHQAATLRTHVDDPPPEPGGGCPSSL